ncbi:hypothetical protein [Streptomyces sp. NPDC059788]|uniref:hypothetical protein n=1 Tax=Streptomyces sp. NPDC059788 TaxID=3346948 RepID=UPI00365FB60E
MSELLQCPMSPPLLRLALLDPVLDGQSAEPQGSAGVRFGIGGVGEGSQLGCDLVGLYAALVVEGDAVALVAGSAVLPPTSERFRGRRRQS